MRPSALHSRPPEAAPGPRPHRDSPDGAVAKGHLPLAVRDTRESPAGGRGQSGKMWRGQEWLEVVGAQVRRILISWTERQTDRRTLHPLQPCFPGSPWALCLAFWGAAGGVATGSRSREAPGPCSHIHTQASMYRDTPTQTHTSTHKHAPMPINTHTRTNMYRPTGNPCLLASLVSTQWGLGGGGVSSSHACRRPCTPPWAGSEGQEQAVPGAPM